MAFGFVFFGFFIFNLSKAVHFSNELVFHDDEFQHTHLAWNTFQGKVIYRDFFDSHGPLSAFFNSLLFKLKAGEVASVETLYFLRHVNLIAMGVTALFLFGCIYVLTKNVVWGFLAMALYTGTLSIKTSAFQIRPDGYVALFALGSLWLWLTRRRFLSGIFLGICLGFHPKFLPINLAVLAADFFILTKRKREGSVFTLLLGEFIVLGVISLWFLQKGAFQLAVEGQWVSNFERAYSAVIIKKDYFRLLRANRGFETGLFVFCVLNLIVILKQAFSKKNISFDSDILMSSIFSGAGLLFLFAPVWGHAVIFVVPISLVVFIALCGRVVGTNQS
ncbi:MAG: hypothetical protein EBQ92_07510 [Proteobacteria bacterium]|nr:hypothetical protein [Pseudomonadota bacterium]